MKQYDIMAVVFAFQNKTCVQTLQGHAANISAVAFHPELPIIMTGSEDGMYQNGPNNYNFFRP